jgi:hypothetical protein
VKSPLRKKEQKRKSLPQFLHRWDVQFPDAPAECGVNVGILQHCDKFFSAKLCGSITDPTLRWVDLFAKKLSQARALRM